MGREKKTRKAKLAAKAKQRKAIRKKMGKPIYLTLICCPRPIHRLINKFITKQRFIELPISKPKYRMYVGRHHL